MEDVPAQDRPWREDLKLPPYARSGTTYDHSSTYLDRGHMARHSMNRGWGVDSSNWGTKMSNSAPQHQNINRFSSTWRTLEDEIQEIVVDDDAGIEAVWTISGTIYRDVDNPDAETAEDDFANVVRFSDGDLGIPDATCKIVGWFDNLGLFQARAYVFDQQHHQEFDNGGQVLRYTFSNPRAPLETCIRRIDDVEQRTGVDFFPMLRNNIENLIEGDLPDSTWNNL